MSGERRLRIGLIGCGVVARRHAQSLLAEQNRAEVVLCCDPREETATALHNEFFPRAAIHTDDREALEKHLLDAVIIASPTQAHHAQASRALDQGLHVLCEKPLAVRREEILDLIQRRDRSGKILSIGYQRRYKSVYATARRELTEQAELYGPLKEVHLYVCEHWQRSIHGTWRDDPAVGFGYFGDAGTHQIDVIQYVTGRKIEEVLAYSDKRGSRVEIVTQALARLDGGIGLFAHFVGDANHWREDVHFHCQKADLLIRNAYWNAEEIFRCRDNSREEIKLPEPEGNPVRGFLDGIQTGRGTISPAEVALPMYDWTAAVMQSIKRKDWVRLSPESGK